MAPPHTLPRQHQAPAERVRKAPSARLRFETEDKRENVHVANGPQVAKPKGGFLMPTSLSGGCACGAIRYRCAAEPIVAWNCHCCDCQRASGGAFTPVFYVAKSALTVTGEINSTKFRLRAAIRTTEGSVPNAARRYAHSHPYFPPLWVFSSGAWTSRVGCDRP
jgi:Glutathione-dependent formaldehyde-activating enzyme